MRFGERRAGRASPRLGVRVLVPLPERGESERGVDCRPGCRRRSWSRRRELQWKGR